MEGMAEAAIDFLTALGVERVDLLGWSVGGFVALDRPALVRKLIVAGSGPGGVPGTPDLEQRVVEYMTAPETTLSFSSSRRSSARSYTTSSTAEAPGPEPLLRTCWFTATGACVSPPRHRAAPPPLAPCAPSQFEHRTEIRATMKAWLRNVVIP